MFKKVILVAVALWFIQGAFSVSAKANKKCKGWACKEVTCWDGYAVYIPEKDAYLPCKDFDRYINGDANVLLRKEVSNAR